MSINGRDIMGIADVDRNLASNRLIFDIRKDATLMADFHTDMEAVFDRYDLTEPEKQAWRSIDLAAMAKLGVHPYFLPQISRIFEGGAYNHNNSAAAQLYAKTMVAQGESRKES